MIFHVSQQSEDAASQYQPLAANIIVCSNLISGEPSSSSISYLANNVRELVELGNVLVSLSESSQANRTILLDYIEDFVRDCLSLSWKISSNLL